METEYLFNTDVTFLLPTDSTEVLIAGDFNRVISQADCTGKPNTSRALATLIRVMGLCDVWKTHPHIPAYTHYTNVGASRIDRIYITDPLQRRKQGLETVAAGFSDHFAVIIWVALGGISILQKARVCRMNTTLLEESSFRKIIKKQWGKWKKNIRYYANKVMWWDKLVKRRIQHTFQREGAERNRGWRELGNHYYDMIYRVIRYQSPQAEKAIHLRKLKVKII